MCEKIIITHSCIAGAGGLIPFPVAGLVVATGSLWIMYGRITSVLDIKVSENFGKTIGSFVIGNITGNVAAVLAMLAGSFVKSIPGIGTVIGELSEPLADAVAVYVAGIVFIKALTTLAKSGKPVDETEIKDALKAEFSDKESIEAMKKDAKENLRGTDFSAYKKEAGEYYEKQKR